MEFLTTQCSSSHANSSLLSPDVQKMIKKINGNFIADFYEIIIPQLDITHFCLQSHYFKRIFFLTVNLFPESIKHNILHWA
jgi:hypothetical protein